MGLHHHRKLLRDGPDDPCGRRKSSCLPPSSFPPPFGEEGYEDNKNPPTKHTTKISTSLIITFAVVATAFFLLCSYAIYAKFFSSRNRSRRRLLSRQQTEAEGFDDEEEEEQGPVAVVDHPIWYIRTTGLQQSVIGAITVCKYKRGEGLIEGTECSVCLSEFQEDENLRLLPKCNHAFHLPCIDTWLRSHTNCPLCRAPIVTDPTIRFIPSVEANAVASTSLENAQREGLEHSGGEGSGGMEDSEEGEQVEEGTRVCETAGSLASEVVNMQPRRSVSLDSSSAAKISLALASVMSVESNRNSKRVSGNGKGGSSSSSSRTRYLHSEPSSMKRSKSFNAKHLISWYSRSQRKPNPPLRSF